jgi:MYXO-CTERM domain-containing protein
MRTPKHMTRLDLIVAFAMLLAFTAAPAALGQDGEHGVNEGPDKNITFVKDEDPPATTIPVVDADDMDNSWVRPMPTSEKHGDVIDSTIDPSLGVELLGGGLEFEVPDVSGATMIISGGVSLEEPGSATSNLSVGAGAPGPGVLPVLVFGLAACGGRRRRRRA